MKAKSLGLMAWPNAPTLIVCPDTADPVQYELTPAQVMQLLKQAAAWIDSNCDMVFTGEDK